MTNKTSDNNLTNNNTINVNVEYPKKRTYKAKPTAKKSVSSNWYKKTIITSIIALLLSLGGYLFNNFLNTKNKFSTNPLPSNNQIEGIKQN